MQQTFYSVHKNALKFVLRDSEKKKKKPQKILENDQNYCSNQNQGATCPIIQHWCQVHNQQEIYC